MKKLFLTILFFTICLNLFSCQNINSDSCNLSSGTYYMLGNYEELMTPYVALNFEDYTFRMGAGALFSYEEHGEFIIENDTIKATSQSTIFIFKITDNNSLVLIDNGDNEYFQMPENSEFVFRENDSNGKEE